MGGRSTFTWVDSGRARGNGFQLKKEGSFRLDVGEFFTEKVVMQWHRLPWEVVDAPSLRCSRPGWMGP